MLGHRFTRSAVLGVTIAAIAAPTSFAKIHDEAVVGAGGGVAAAQIRDETVLHPATATTIRDETVLPAAPSVAVVSSPGSGDGIDWADTAIGAGGMLALIGLGLGGAALAARHRRVQPRRVGKLTT